MRGECTALRLGHVEEGLHDLELPCEEHQVTPQRQFQLHLLLDRDLTLEPCSASPAPTTWTAQARSSPWLPRLVSIFSRTPASTLLIRLGVLGPHTCFSHAPTTRKQRSSRPRTLTDGTRCTRCCAPASPTHRNAAHARRPTRQAGETSPERCRFGRLNRLCHLTIQVI